MGEERYEGPRKRCVRVVQHPAVFRALVEGVDQAESGHQFRCNSQTGTKDSKGKIQQSMYMKA